jgi:hypothetical protein
LAQNVQSNRLTADLARVLPGKYLTRVGLGAYVYQLSGLIPLNRFQGNNRCNILPVWREIRLNLFVLSVYLLHFLSAQSVPSNLGTDLEQPVLLGTDYVRVLPEIYGVAATISIVNPII